MKQINSAKNLISSQTKIEVAQNIWNGVSREMRNTHGDLRYGVILKRILK